MPFAFTEHGVLMLSSVLNSSNAIMINIQIVRIFSRLRHALLESTEIKLEIERIKKELSNQGKNIDLIFHYVDELVEHKNQPRKRIGYKPDQD